MRSASGVVTNHETKDLTTFGALRRWGPARRARAAGRPRLFLGSADLRRRAAGISGLIASRAEENPSIVSSCDCSRRCWSHSRVIPSTATSTMMTRYVTVLLPYSRFRACHAPTGHQTERIPPGNRASTTRTPPAPNVREGSRNYQDGPFQATSAPGPSAGVPPVTTPRLPPAPIPRSLLSGGRSCGPWNAPAGRAL